MNSNTAKKLIELNRVFYDKFGDSFSATRQHIQPGVRKIMGSFNGDEDILDLGCGNGEFARQLAKAGHRGSYLGVDFSLPLLRDANAPIPGFNAKFIEADLTRLEGNSENILAEGAKWKIVTTFATLHHIPSMEMRLGILRFVHKILSDDGLFIHSNWQFLNSEKLKARVQPWEAAAISPSEVDANDHLLDWRSGGEGLRYAHQYDEAELSALAGATGFRILDSFYSDGENNRLGLYQIWKK